MLKDSFYHILHSDKEVHTIRFNASHPVFSGHFPERPIVPGACLVQIAEELAVLTYGHSVRFTAVRDLKLRQPITPDQKVTFQILKDKDSMCVIQCGLSTDERGKEMTKIVSLKAQFVIP